jgi:DNA segregation ATPase FtsK/SpoIIIE, S-DNA-T family
MRKSIAERLESIAKEILALAADLKGARQEVGWECKAEMDAIEKQYGSQARKVFETLKLFDVDAEMRYFERGPVVDRVVFSIPPGTRYSDVTACKDNLMGALQTAGIRIESPMPGSNAVSVEFPHEKGDREEIEWNALTTRDKLAGFTLPLVVGKTSVGEDLILELATLPHLLVGGAAGQGKTTLLNSIICGLVSNYSPDEVRLILYDAKCVEFTMYCALPHLAMPIINDTRRFVFALHWAVAEMEKRFKQMARARCRNIGEFNAQGKEKLPYIVVIVDECADMIAEAGKELLPELSRLTAKSRAAGIHMILATSRTDVKVLSGMLKANIPGRIAFKTANAVDSRVVLDETGAEDLIGRGDMLMRGKNGQIVRAQGAVIRDPDIATLVDKAEKEYKIEPLFKVPEEVSAEQKQPAPEPPSDEQDYERALDEIRRSKTASTSHFQRKLGWGYNHAAKILDLLEERGVVAPQVRAGARAVYFDKIPPKAKAKKGKRK